ncbi:MAG TPA: hypothetical protein VNT25_01660 [Allosphingosinicella sp.]|nr:hypothetical protein [Allosphingosinicella sp.]
MSPFHCSVEKPWGIHQSVRNDEQCPRCGWLAPGATLTPPLPRPMLRSVAFEPEALAA